MEHKIIHTENYLIVVSDDEIKKGDLVYVDCPEIDVKDIREVNDYYNEQFLFKNGGQIHIDYCKKIIAHLPLNNSPILQGVDLLPPLEQKDDVENIVRQEIPTPMSGTEYIDERKGFIKGYNRAKERYKYTEEDMRKVISMVKKNWNDEVVNEEEIIQSLSQPKLPVAFKCEMVDFEVDMGLGEECIEYNQYPKTTTNNGQTVWVGEYKF